MTYNSLPLNHVNINVTPSYISLELVLLNTGFISKRHNVYHYLYLLLTGHSRQLCPIKPSDI